MDPITRSHSYAHSNVRFAGSYKREIPTQALVTRSSDVILRGGESHLMNPTPLTDLLRIPMSSQTIGGCHPRHQRLGQPFELKEEGTPSRLLSLTLARQGC